MVPLIFVYDGLLPEYSFYSIKLSKKLSKKKIILLITKNNKNIPKGIEHHFIEDFYKGNLSKDINFSNYHKKFWNGFWVKTIERFFILESFCKHFKIENFFYAELDNIVFDIEFLDKKLDKFGKKIFFTKERFDRGMVGFLYINSVTILSEFCNFCLKNLKKKYFIDYELLGNFSNLYEEKCVILPNELHAFQNDKISFKAIDASELDGIVDGARVGSFLFGIEPRIVSGFVYNMAQPIGTYNKTNFNYNDLRFIYSKSKKKLSIQHKTTSKSVKIYNLHIHSKLFKKISKDKYFIKIINKVNSGEKTLMSFNLKNIFKNIIGTLNSRFSKNKTIN
jgi:hypothetical protein